MEWTKELKALKYLKDFGRQPTSKIASHCGMNTKVANEVLDQLHKERKVRKIALPDPENPLAVYWEITEIGKKVIPEEEVK